jgi:hypothetical protein
MRPPPRRRLVTSVMLTAAGCSKKSTLAAPLIDAARDGDVAKCEHMVKRGFRVNETDDHGDTTLSWARRRLDRMIVVDMILKVSGQCRMCSTEFRATQAGAGLRATSTKRASGAGDRSS